MKAKGQKKKKKTTKKNKQTKSLLNTILLCTLVLGISYLIFETNILEPKIDGVTASYISFDNLNSTDMMKIKDLSKTRWVILILQLLKSIIIEIENL